MNKSSTYRPGFTLVEMLIVLFIIVAVAGIFVPVILNLTDRNQVPKGASILENALSLAKSRAVGEKRANGVRILLTGSNLRTTTGGASFAWYDELQFIEDPGDYSNAWVWGFANAGVQTSLQPFWDRVSPSPNGGSATPSPGVPPFTFDNVDVAAVIPNFSATLLSGQGTVSAVGPPGPTTLVVARNQLVFGPISMQVSGGDNNQLTIPKAVPPNFVYRSQRMGYNWYSRTPTAAQPLQPQPIPVQPGDVLELTGVGETYTIIGVSLDQAAGNNNTNVNISATAFPIRVPILVLDRPLTRDLQPSLNGRPNYRIIRQPRAISSLNSMKLPQDVVIDMTPSRVNFPAPDTDTSNSIYMSGVSSGINVSSISNLAPTSPPTPNSGPPDYIDIMFSPSGEVMPTSQSFPRNPLIGKLNNGAFNTGASGLIALWVHQRGDPNLWAQRQITAAQGNADNQAIVAINGRTGFIGSYPINKLTPDPLANARLGRARSSTDTGP